MSISETKKLARKIHGWLTDKEGELLYNLAKKCTGKGVIVEIGSWKGKSTVWLGKGSKSGKGTTVYAIDPHMGETGQRTIQGKTRTLEEFKRNIKDFEVDDMIISIVKTSEKAAKDFGKPVELIFVDGSHEYDHVRLDFDLWFPKVIDGGTMAFHDTTGNLGPKRVVKESVYKSNNFKNIGFVHSITYAEKVRQNSLRDKLRNIYILLLKHLFEFSFRFRLPKPIKRVGKRFLRRFRGE